MAHDVYKTPWAGLFRRQHVADGAKANPTRAGLLPRKARSVNLPAKKKFRGSFRRAVV